MQFDPFHDNTIYDVMNNIKDEGYMMNMLKNMNNENLSNFMECLERCSEETSQKWRSAYLNLQVKW